MSLFIKDFSEISELSPQTLRFYHSEGLLIPSEVDEETGYRYYQVEQVETAMLVTALRGAGMSVKDVRRAQEAPDTAIDLFEAHTEALHRRRAAEDEALGTARELLTARPEVRRKESPGTTVLWRAVPPVAEEKRRGQPHLYDWGGVADNASAVAGELSALAEEHGATVAGTPWFSMGGENREQRRKARALEGPQPHWLVNVPVRASADVLSALAEQVAVQGFAARDEVSIHMPGRNSAAKFVMAQVRLNTYDVPEGYFAAPAETRHLLHGDGIETSMPLRLVSEAEDPGGEDPS